MAWTWNLELFFAGGKLEKPEKKNQHYILHPADTPYPPLPPAQIEGHEYEI
jgi:hypothetical protein